MSINYVEIRISIIKPLLGLQVVGHLPICFTLYSLPFDQLLFFSGGVVMYVVLLLRVFTIRFFRSLFFVV